MLNEDISHESNALRLFYLKKSTQQDGFWYSVTMQRFHRDIFLLRKVEFIVEHYHCATVALITKTNEYKNTAKINMHFSIEISLLIIN